ncbi:FxsA family protein [Kineococcus sp. SYSU DK005]|uniref:FxsA family protein n=1 Tax=Kineococcus sp. SYSU DK005 TaxID=3383126 RepID=UPI003D7D7501
MSLPLGPGPGGAARGARPVRRVRPSRALAVLLALAALLALEVWLLAQLAHVVGSAGVLALLLVETLAGVLVLRRAGRRALAALRAAGPLSGAGPAARTGAAGPERVGDALLVGVGGALLVLPGLLTDLVALLCLLPPSRALLRRLGARLLRSRVRRALRRAGLDPNGPLGAHLGARGAGGAGRVVDGEVVDDVLDGEVLDDTSPAGGPGAAGGAPRALGPAADPRRRRGWRR